MRELQTFQTMLRQDEANFSPPEVTKVQLWNRVMKILKKEKAQTTKEKRHELY